MDILVKYCFEHKMQLLICPLTGSDDWVLRVVKDRFYWQIMVDGKNHSLLDYERLVILEKELILQFETAYEDYKNGKIDLLSDNVGVFEEE